MGTKDCALSQYTNDNLLFYKIMRCSDYATMQDNIDLVHGWFREWLMEFNISTCKFMVISRKHSKCCPPIQLLVDGVGKVVNEYKYLGVWLSDTLGWSEHAKKLYGEHLHRLV